MWISEFHSNFFSSATESCRWLTLFQGHMKTRTFTSLQGYQFFARLRCNIWSLRNRSFESAVINRGTWILRKTNFLTTKFTVAVASSIQTVNRFATSGQIFEQLKLDPFDRKLYLPCMFVFHLAGQLYTESCHSNNGNISVRRPNACHTRHHD